MLYLVIALFILCGVADCWTTYVDLRKWPGQAYEANPIAAFSMKHLGVLPGMILLKVLCSAVIVAVIILTGWVSLGGLFLLGYLYVLYNNLAG